MDVARSLASEGVPSDTRSVGADVDLRVLGQVELVVDGRSVPIGHVKHRCVLAILVLECNRVVTTETIIDRVWGDDPPVTVRNLLSGYVAKLRTTVATSLSSRGAVLARRPGGYLLQIDPDVIDLWRFRRFVERARQAPQHDRLFLWSQAVNCWRGSAFGGAASPWLLSLRDALDAERLLAEIGYADEVLRLGGYDELLARLPAMGAQYPLNEKIAGQRMLALYHRDRHSDALAVYGQLRSRLREELGADPTPALQQLHAQLLRREVAPSPGLAPVVARQLPPAPGSFTGRAALLRRLDGSSESSRHGPQKIAGAISVIVGAPGVGKTALALSWAHRSVADYPDGQLYLNLRGFDPRLPPLPASQALARLLRSLGVPAEAISVDLDEQGSLYRSLLADKRMLIFLDDAADSEQVQPLLPGSATCTVLVTSRQHLSGVLTREGSRLIQLGTLSARESRALLRRVVGRRRVDADPAAADQIAQLCGYLPLAIRIAADQLVGRRDLTMARLVDRFTREHDRLDALAVAQEPVTVRAAFSLSYRELDPATARAFRLLGLSPAPAVSLPAAAALIGSPEPATRVLLDRLCHRHLVEAVGSDRYQFHDLLRLYAAERAQVEDGATACAQAVGRMMAWYLAAALAADRLLAPRRYRRPLEPLTPLSPPLPFDADFTHALRWCDAESANLLAVIEQADRWGVPDVVWQLALALREYFEIRKPWNEWRIAYEFGLAAAQRGENCTAAAAMQLGLGTVHYFPRRFEQALTYYRQAQRGFHDAGDPWGEGTALNGIGNVFLETRQLDLAIEYYQAALRCYQGADPVRDQGVAYNNLAETLCLLGRYPEALAYAERSVEIDRETGSYRIEVFASCHAADALSAMQRFDEAWTYLQNAGARAAAIEDRHALAWALLHHGQWCERQNRTQEARDLWTKAVTLFDSLGDPQAHDLRARAAALPRQ